MKYSYEVQDAPNNILNRNKNHHFQHWHTYFQPQLIRGRRHYVAEERLKNYMYQLMKAMDHMHRNGIFHRDIKPENVLIMDDCLKLADFGSCRGIYSKQPYTEYISTRWYRAPECLLTDGCEGSETLLGRGAGSSN